MSQRSLAKRAWYGVLKVLCRTLSLPLFGFRSTGAHLVPRQGPVLVLANHQSHLDPVLVGMCFSRRLNYVARDTLFRFKPLAWLINSLDAIPIDREGLGLAGLKATLRRLKAGEMVLLFPEGTRTRDGEVQPLKPGFCAVARRSAAALLPVAIDGAFQAWPRTCPLPRPGQIVVHIGQPITAEEAAQIPDDDALLALVAARLQAAHAAARAQRCRSRM